MEKLLHKFFISISKKTYKRLGMFTRIYAVFYMATFFIGLGFINNDYFFYYILFTIVFMIISSWFGLMWNMHRDLEKWQKCK